MSTPLDIEHLIGQIHLFNEWLIALPLPPEYRERTTYREFNELMMAKQAELGLSQEIIAQLNQVQGNKELDWAFMEVGMTQDNRELVSARYEWDLPLNYRWMPEYEPLANAVDEFFSEPGRHEGAEDEALLEVVRRHVPSLSKAPP